MASILIVDDEPAVAASLATFFERTGGHTVAAVHNGADGLKAFRRSNPDLVLLDMRLPDMTGFDVLEEMRHAHAPVIMITGYGDVALAVQAMQRGAENFLTKPVELSHLAVVAERAFEKTRLRQMNAHLSSRLERVLGGAGVILGSSLAMRELMTQIEQLAASDRTTVLIMGESGTGKGRIAELVHARSDRAGRPLVELNCAALTASNIESELFGADQNGNGERTGLCDVAAGGSLFLDEIGDLDLHVQPKLLGVLEGKGFRRVGGTREIDANIRVIAATAKDLVNEVTAGTFREDLYYRLNVMPVYLPPLRARVREDLVELVAHVLGELRPVLPEAPSGLTDEALEQVLRYGWPGNIRELRNVMERAMIMARGQEQIGLMHLPQDVCEATGVVREHHVPRSLNEVERSHIDRTLRVHSGNRTKAARELSISRATLIKKIREYGL